MYAECKSNMNGLNGLNDYTSPNNNTWSAVSMFNSLGLGSDI